MLPEHAPSRVPISTYRLQLNQQFPFEEARRIAGYLKQLGITEYYCSSFLAAKPGSTHGYDLCDHSRINPELGGLEAFRQFAKELREHGFGLILDFVPNHMSTDPAANLWWRDVLANGPSSPYASFFDIDWEPVKRELKNRVLLPVLGSQYGVTLESGQLQLDFSGGAFRLNYFDLDLPLNPRQLRMLLGHRLDSLVSSVEPADPHLNEFRSILFHLEHMPAYTETNPEMVESRHREKDVALGRLERLAGESIAIQNHIKRNIQEFNGTPDQRTSYDLLHELLELQPYRLSYWRTAMHEINYRRFFDINELAGLRMEEPEAFRCAHEFTFGLIRNGDVTGLRMDHIDGLYDPSSYLNAVVSSPELGGKRPYLVVEKILSIGEELPEQWKSHGTSGYEFLNDVTGLFVDLMNASEFSLLHQRFTGQVSEFADVVYASKRLIIETSMASELNVLAHELNRISEGDWRSRDFTLDSLQEALREIVACFPVYRTYAAPDGWSSLDEQNIDQAVSMALRRNPALEPSIFHFVRQMLLPRRTPEIREVEYARRVRFAMKFQQYTGPVQAKGVEDTAFYRYGPLLSLNEVGGHPDHFGRTVEAFHVANQHRERSWPLTMLTTSTHDTKRGEDARARISVLSEMPAEWRTAISRWARANASATTMVRGEPAPGRSDQYLYYQALLGAWPPGLSEQPPAEFVDRMRGYMKKAVKEKKTRTSWINPSEEYDAAVSNFVERSLTGRNAHSFLTLFVPFAKRIASLGMVNSLAQLLLKIGSPGVPDFYQGSELWELSLVDPDNRRPVDFRLREAMLDDCLNLLEDRSEPGDRLHALAEMLSQWHDGRIKLFCTAAGLRLRRRLPEVFVGGQYIPLAPEGPAANHLVAFARVAGAKCVVIIVPRLVAALSGSGSHPPTGPTVWKDTSIPLPEPWQGTRLRNVLTGETFSLPAGQSGVLAAQALKVLPVAILENLEKESA